MNPNVITTIPPDLPLSPPPPGTHSNFTDPVSRAGVAFAVMGLCMGISTVAVALRCWVRGFLTKEWGVQDYALILAWISIMAYDALTISITGPGKVMGLHSWDVRLVSETESYAKRALGALQCYNLAALFVKLSLFSFYHCLFSAKPVTRYLIYAGALATTVMYVSCIIAGCILFIPAPSSWGTTIGWVSRLATTWTHSRALALAQGIFGTVSDVYLLAIPLHCIWQLRMPRRKAWSVSVVFMSGIVGVGCSLAGVIFRATWDITDDITWIGLTVYILSTAEITAGIVCCSLPVCASLLNLRPSKAQLRLPSDQVGDQVPHGTTSSSYDDKQVFRTEDVEDPESQIHRHPGGDFISFSAEGGSGV